MKLINWKRCLVVLSLVLIVSVVAGVFIGNFRVDAADRDGIHITFGTNGTYHTYKNTRWGYPSNSFIEAGGSLTDSDDGSTTVKGTGNGSFFRFDVSSCGYVPQPNDVIQIFYKVNSITTSTADPPSLRVYMGAAGDALGENLTFGHNFFDFRPNLSAYSYRRIHTFRLRDLTNANGKVLNQIQFAMPLGYDSVTAYDVRFDAIYIGPDTNAPYYNTYTYKNADGTTFKTERVLLTEAPKLADTPTKSGSKFVSWVHNNTAKDHTTVVVGNLNNPQTFTPRFLSNSVVGGSDGLVYSRTVTQYIPQGYTATTLPEDQQHKYQIKIEFYYYGKEPTGPVKIFENLEGAFTTAHGQPFVDEFSVIGKNGTVNVYRAPYTGNGQFGALERIGAGNNGYDWENVYLQKNANDIDIHSEVYHGEDSGNPKAVHYNYFVFRFFDQNRNKLLNVDNSDGKHGHNDGEYYRKRADLQEYDKDKSGLGYKYVIVLDVALLRERTIGGNNMKISYDGLLPSNTKDEKTGLTVLANTDINTTTSGIKVYDANMTKITKTVPFHPTENANVKIMYDFCPHDYYMDLYDIPRLDVNGNQTKNSLGLLTAVYNEKSDKGRMVNHEHIYGQMFTHGNSPVYAEGKGIPNTDVDKTRNAYVDLNYSITLTNKVGNVAAGTEVYRTYCYQDDHFTVDTDGRSWYKSSAKIDWTKDHAITVTAIAKPITADKDSFGRDPYGLDSNKNVVGETITAQSYFFAPRYIVADYGKNIAIPMQQETQNTTEANRPTFQRAPSVKSGVTNYQMNVTLPAKVAVSGNNVVYSFTKNDAYTNKPYSTSKRQILTGIDKSITYTVEAVNALKHKDVGCTETRQTKVTRTLYIIPATTVMYDQDAIQFLSGKDGAELNSFGANAKWVLEGGSYNTQQNNGISVRYGYDENIRLNEQGGTSDKPTAYVSEYNNQLDFNGGAVYAHVDGSYASDGKTRANQNQYAQFTFTGTGFDLYSRTGETTGAIVAEVYDSTGKNIQNILVDTYMAKITDVQGDSTLTFDTLYQIPVILYKAPSYGTYTVKLRAYYHEIFDHYYVPPVPEESSEGGKRSATVITEDLVRELLGWDENVPLSMTLSEDRAGRPATRNAEGYQTDNAYDVYIDGVRIYNTLNKVAAHSYKTLTQADDTPNYLRPNASNASSALAHYAYGLAGEINPQYINLNQLLLDASDTSWAKDLNNDSDTGDVNSDINQANDVTGILFITGQNGRNAARVDEDDKYVGIHLGMSGQVYTRDVADGQYLKQYLLRADGTELKHETYNTSIYFYTKDKKYYCTDSAGKAVVLSAIDVNLAFGNEITFYDSKYKTVGPENEIYLTDYNGIALYIGDNIPTGTKIHLSLKTINGRKAIMRSFNNNNGTEDQASWETLNHIRITDTAGSSVFTTKTEMYYDFSNMIYRDADGKCYLFLQHANDGYQAIVSLCNLKIIGNVTIRPAVNFRTIMLANEIFYDTPIDESMEIRHSLNLASDISVNYVVPANLLEGAESSYLTVEVPRYEGNTLIGSETVTIEPVLVGKLYYYTLKGLTAVNMNDELKATLYYVKDGETYRSYEDIYSIATYAYNQLNGKSVPESLKTLCANLLRYGAAAQAYKGYRTDCPADGALREADRIYLTDPETVPFGTTNEVMKDLEAPSVTWKGKVLNLESKIALKFVIDPTNYEGNAETLSLRITYRKSNGEEETVILSESELYTEGRPYRAFEFNGLLAAELRTVLTVAVYDGETRVSDTLLYAADSYGRGKTGDLGTLCKALFAYVDVAKAFFEG